MRKAHTFKLSEELVATHGGGPVVCLDARAIGRTYALHASRPGAELNERVERRAFDDIDSSFSEEPENEALVSITVVTVSGPIEQHAGYHDMCGGWSEGHDAIAERMIDALASGDVVMVFDSPGGACAGLQENVRRVVEAKEASGRRVVGVVNELCGSAAYWWAAVVCDEIYAPEAGIVGSIGARAAHASVAGALAQDGIAVTYAAWPGAGKIALAPELPLSDLGKARLERDVDAAGLAFAAAVSPRRGLSIDDIVALNADALSGQAAVDAKLIDGIASLEDVLESVLVNATASAAAQVGSQSNALAARETVMQIRAEGEETKDKAPESEPEGKQPSSVCAACGMQQRPEAKHCDQCGASMAAVPEQDDDPPADPAAPPAEKKAPPVAPPGKPAATLAAVFGLRSDASNLAIKTAAEKWQREREEVMSVTGASSMRAAIGNAIAHASDSRRLAEVENDLRSMRLRADWTERMGLLRKLSDANIPGYARGDLLIDEADDDGKRTNIRPTKVYAEMNLGTLKALVDSKLKNAGPTRKPAPFEPSRDAAKAASGKQNAAAAKNNPVVKKAAERSFASEDLLAAAYAAQFPEDINLDHGADR